MLIPIKNIFKSDSNRTNVYNIINVDTGAYLGAAQSPSEPAIAQTSDIDNSTKWSLILNDDGNYNIDSLDSGVLRATGPSFNPPNVIVSTNTEPITFDDDKEFDLLYNEVDDTYRIRVSGTNQYVYHNDDGNFYTSEAYSIPNDTWKIVEVESWWSKDKIDKINLNFELLSSGGMKGPVGNFGEDGLTGPQGPQGYQGPQGLQGSQGISPWTEGSNNDFLTLHPNFQVGSEYQPIRIGIGQTDDEQVAINFQGPLTKLHNHETSISNLIINSPNSLDFHFKLSPEGDFKKLEIGDIINSASKLKLQYDLDTMDYILHNDPSNTNYLLEANQAVSNVNNNTNLKFRSKDTKLGLESSNIIANSNFKYTNDALENRVLVSLDNNGNTAWRNKSDVFGTLPVGSIISITEDWFNDDNFYLTYQISQSGSELKIIYGRGRENTPFEGWYICNGQTWTDGNIQYEVPNLNSFDFDIDSNGGDQESVTDGDNTPIIIGGYNLEMQSTYDTTDSKYISEFIEPTDTTTDQISLNTGGNFDISRNVHIIYLKVLDYFWTTGDIEPIILTPIELAGPSTSSDDACGLNTTQTYEWTGGAANWANDDMSNIILYIILYNNNNERIGLTRALAGWYSKDDISRYWNGSQFSLREVCPILIPIDLTFDNDVTNLNGITSSSNTEYIINSEDFENATSLLQGGSNAAAGWYREFVRFGYRRYWNGSEFIGEKFNTNYIYKAGVIGASSTINTACQSSDPTPIYYATNQPIPTPDLSLTELHRINSLGGTVLVHLNWNGNEASGDKPLVKIYNQNAPGISGKYTALTDVAEQALGGDTYTSTITINSTINQPIQCRSYELASTNDGDAYRLEPPNISITSNIRVDYLPATITFKAFGGTSIGSSIEGKLTIYGLQGGNEVINLSAPSFNTSSTFYTFQETGEFAYVMKIETENSNGNNIYLSIE
jgi:hypothetical protein